MKINELITWANQDKTKLLKNEQQQNALKKQLNVKDYISIKQKKELVDNIVDECIFYEAGVFKFDNIDKYVCFTMRAIEAYTNIELSDDLENDYDMLCENNLLNLVIDAFRGEYENVKVLLQMKCDYILSGNTIEAQLGRFLNDVSHKIDDVIGTFSNAVGNFDLNKLPISMNDISKLMNLINVQQK